MSAASDEEARQLVLKTLREPAVRLMSYTVCHFFMPATDYERIAKAVDKKQIKVVDNPDFVNNAVYNSTDNQITIAARGDNLSKRALLVHELTHAIQDARRMNVTHGDAEMLAYIAQQLYVLKSGGSVGADPLLYNADMNVFGWNAIWWAANSIATLINQNQPVPADQVETLRNGLRLTDWYKDIVAAKWDMDGVGDEEEKKPSEKPVREWHWQKG